MKSSVLVLFVFGMTFAACGGESRSAKTAGGATSQNSNVSFGLYDISSRGPLSGVAEALTARPGDGKPVATDVNAPTNTSSNTSSDDKLSTQPIDRKVVRNADLDLESNNPEEAQQKVTAIAESNSGFVVESNQSSSDIQTSSHNIITMTFRVPTERFEQALEETRKVADRVVTENVKGQDVTEEFIDIEASLKAKKALEAQSIDIMRRATSIQEALNVQGQLATVRADIDKIEGRRRFLENQSSLSTIKIRVQTPKLFAASSQGFGGLLADSFEAGLNVAMNFMLGLITFIVAVLPFALIVGLPGVFLFRYFWRRQAGPKSVSEIARDEID